MLFVLFLLFCTVLCEEQVAAITYLDTGTCNLESDATVELWVNSVQDVCKLTSVVVNGADLKMEHLSLNNGITCEGNCVSKLKKIETEEIVITQIGDSITFDMSLLSNLIRNITNLQSEVANLTTIVRL